MGVLLLLLLGAGLILAAALGAFPRAQAIGLERAGWPLRAALATAGLLCVIAAVSLMGDDTSKLPPGPVTVAIATELDAEQVSQEVRVFLDGRDVGVIKIDQHSPKARLMVTVTKAGGHDYRTESKSQLKGQKPTAASNDGEVEIDGKSSLTLFYDGEGRTYLKPPSS